MSPASSIIPDLVPKLDSKLLCRLEPEEDNGEENQVSNHSRYARLWCVLAVDLLARFNRRSPNNLVEFDLVA
ncbi:hypothetical protein TIFTF001_027767 [Ficus carica]|uniref:Uncharacterized protein n=1 Tax=Ficus carica TaxID=3494 RepID=A0AA88IZ38_FICCA|nr:hypothetical protein TIFTF001_027767 [Ficus carica]